MCRRSSRACFHRSDFQSKNFSYAIFIVNKKRPLYVNFSIPLCAKWCFFQGSISLMDMRFCLHVPNSPRNKSLKSLNPYPLYKMVFLASKTLLYSLSTRNFYFFSTLNLMILQTIWNEHVRFGGHINIQANYKILLLEVYKKASILHNLPCFQEGLFWGSFGLNVAHDV
jgi:hypothetical protein